MKQAILTVFGLFLLITGLAQHTETRNFSRSFTGIKVGEGIDIVLKKGEKESAFIESNINLSDILTEVSGDYLKIHLQNQRWVRNVSVKVTVTYVLLDKVYASSAANVYAEGLFKASRLKLSASSAANIEMELDVEKLEVEVSSAAEIRLEGKALDVFMESSSAGEIDAYNLSTDVAKAEVSSGATMKVSVQKDFEARASSGGSIRYRGNPSRCITGSSSGGSIRKSN